MATQQDLGRLERVIGAILRGGVAISAVLMVTGLVLTAIGSTHAGLVLNAGLVLLMMIPTARIIVSFVDAALRRDALLAVATAIVIGVIAWQVWIKVGAAIVARFTAPGA